MRLFLEAYARYIRLFFKSIFCSRGTHAPITFKRFCWLIFIIPGLLLSQFMHWTALFLDHLFFPGFKKVQVKEPVFVVGIPRSGTTFLQRLLTADTERFTTLNLWEIHGAPSITERVFWTTLGRIDRVLGGFGRRLLVVLDKKMFQEVSKIHPLSLFEPDEDELLWLPTAACPNLALFFPFKEELWKYGRFDWATNPEEQRRLMAYYKGCVQRHLYFHGPEKQFLAKNPTYAVKLESLRETFPDLKVICTSRTPYEAIPSFMSLGAFYWNRLGCDKQGNALRDLVLEVAQNFYEHPARTLPAWPTDQHAFVKYEDIVRTPKQTVVELFARLNIPLSPIHAAKLQEKEEKARQYRSAHVYSMEEHNLTEEVMLDHFAQVFQYYGYPTHAESATRPAASNS